MTISWRAREQFQERPSPWTRAVGYQSWRDLLFVHFAVDPKRLRECVPACLDLDPCRGEHLVGVVPFRMVNIRPRYWLPNAGLNFLECNVRTYVSYRGEPGVYFFSLEASSKLAVEVARRRWSLPYHHARMFSGRRDRTYHYEAERRGVDRAKLYARWEVGTSFQSSPRESDAFFLLERYLLFTQRKGRLLRGRVWHSPYPASEAKLVQWDCSLLDDLNLGLRDSRPTHTHFADGVDVEVFPLEPV